MTGAFLVYSVGGVAGGDGNGNHGGCYCGGGEMDEGCSGAVFSPAVAVIILHAQW
jgi:hypothetical protein